MNESRTYGIEIDSIEERKDGEMEISGYAIRFNSLSEDLGGFKETISAQALDGVDLSDVYLYHQHNPNEVLGNTKSGTMSLTVTELGLHFRATLPQTTLGRDTYTLLKRGDLKSMSFGFAAEEDSWDMTKTPQIRTIHKFKLIEELSIVSRPAYSATQVSARAKKICEDGLCLQKMQAPKENPLLDEAKALLESI